MMKINKIVLATAFTISCSSGGSGPSSLAGQWEYAGGANKAKYIELFNDGTGVIDASTVSWKAENERLAISSSHSGFSCNYRVSGYELVLAYDDGDSAIFAKGKLLKELKAKQTAEIARQVATCADKDYKTVNIGGKTWMAENFNCNVSGSKCYGNSGANCDKYGRLYNWETAMAVCPAGWHLPSKSEWEALDKAVGGEKAAGKKLKAKNGWSENGSGTDEFGFSALPGGYGRSDGSFYGAGKFGDWWSSGKGNNYYAYARGIYYYYEYADLYYQHKSHLFSVRCVQD